MLNLTNLRTRVAAMWTALLAFAVVNVRELIFTLGLLLVTAGLALVSLPAALIVPGAVFMWLAIPPRATEKSQ